MTDKELKELAEFAAEFLELEKTKDKRFPFNIDLGYGVMSITIKDMLDDCWISATVAYLAKRKMEEMGFEWVHSFNKLPGGKTIFICEVYTATNDFPGTGDNEYIALWLAIREAVKG